MASGKWRKMQLFPCQLSNSFDLIDTGAATYSTAGEAQSKALQRARPDVILDLKTISKNKRSQKASEGGSKQDRAGPACLVAVSWQSRGSLVAVSW